VNFKLSIIVAVYSETVSVMETIERLLKKDRGYIKEIILVVSPKSSKDCFEICRQASLKFNQVKFIVQNHNPGLGLAFREGFDAAEGTHVAIMSADLETQPEAIDRMVCKAVETGCDAVSASRWDKEGGFEGYGRFKMYINYLFQRLFMFLFKTPISDLTLGLKLYRTDLIRNIRLESTGPEVVLESVLKMIQWGAYIEEVPTRWIKRTEGRSKNKSAITTLVKHLNAGLKVYFSPISAWRKI
jgi:dolichol-phosphate mannosyltransferase